GVDALLVFQVAADIDAELGDLAEIGDRLQAHGVQPSPLAGRILDLADEGEAQAIVEALLELDHGARGAGLGPAGQSASANFDFGDPGLHVGAVDRIAETW